MSNILVAWIWYASATLAAAAVMLSPWGAIAQNDSSRGDETILFDGKSLDHWRGYHDEAIGKGWKIVDGVLFFDGSGGGDMVTRDSYSDFELTLDWKVSRGGNSGIMYRVGLGDEAPYRTGPEYQILDDAVHDDGKNELTSAAALYALYKPDGKKLNKVGQWNSARIVVNGNSVEHWLNGKKVVEVDLASEDWKKRVGASKFNEWKKFGTLRTGRICLQDHDDKVWFRNIKIRKLYPEK